VSHHTLIEILLRGRGIVRTLLIEFLLKAEENQGRGIVKSALIEFLLKAGVKRAANRNSFDSKGKN
jgi:hypothetical protein